MNRLVILLFLMPLSSVIAQNNKEENKKAKFEIINYVPAGIRVGTDISKGIGMISNPGFTQYEFHGDIDFGKYFLTADYGFSERPRFLDNLDYLNRGNYYRVGLDYNITPKLKENSVFFIGGRYGWARYSESATLNITNPIYGGGAVEQSNGQLTANWLEFNLGLKVHLAANIFLGYTVRYRTRLNVAGFSNLVPYEVPGYGKFADESNFGLNYHIFYRIPIRKSPESEGKK
jgi:hypothetical protein